MAIFNSYVSLPEGKMFPSTNPMSVAVMFAVVTVETSPAAAIARRNDKKETSDVPKEDIMEDCCLIQNWIPMYISADPGRRKGERVREKDGRKGVPQQQPPVLQNHGVLLPGGAFFF